MEPSSNFGPLQPCTHHVGFEQNEYALASVLDRGVPTGLDGDFSPLYIRFVLSMDVADRRLEAREPDQSENFPSRYTCRATPKVEPMQLHETIKRIRTLPEPVSEEAVKFQVVAPILRDLGWDTTNPAHVEVEYYVGEGADRDKVDMALRGAVGRSKSNKTVGLIEVKRSQEKLERHVKQVVRYAFHAGAVICVLTNGKEWWLYLRWWKASSSNNGGSQCWILEKTRLNK